MNLFSLICCAALALAACQTDSAKREDAATKQPPAGPAGKPQAPVQVDAEVGASSARVTVRFDQAGTGVDVRASGADGLSVQGDGALARGRSVAAGETSTFDVSFTPGAGQSMLVISVRGAFAAGERIAVRAFPVGKPSAEQMSKSDGGTTQIGNERVKLLPADEVKK
jgi:hypothetical protein